MAGTELDGEPRRRALPVVVAGALAVLFVLLLLLARGRGSAATWLSNIGLLLAALTAAGCAAATARRCSGRVARTWALLAASALAWGCGQAVWTWLESVRGEEPLASPADIGYLAALPLTLAALSVLQDGPVGAAGRLRAVLDGLIIGLSTLIVSWVLVLGPVAARQRSTLTEQIVALAYPLGDVLVITLVLYVVLRYRADRRRAPVPVVLIAVALVSLAVADSGFAYLQLGDGYASGSVVDGFWFLGYALLAVAALRQGSTVALPEEESGVRPLGLLVPYVPVLLAVGVSTWHLTDENSATPLIPWLRSALLVTLVARQVLTLRENLDLTAHLERRVAERTAEVTASRARFEALVQHSHDVTTILDRAGAVLYQSASGARLFGHGEDAVHRPYAELVEPDDVPVLSSALAEVARRPLAALSLSLRLRHADGRSCDVETTMTNLLEEPSVGGIVLNTRDVSERQALERRLVHEATHDALTGLANRALFETRVAAALRGHPEPGGVAVIFLDLDGFKAVNDSLGHDAGDQMLRLVAARLRTCVRGTDLVARLGGDEFAVLLAAVEGEARAVELTARLTERLRHTVVLEGREILVQASVGVAVTQGGEDPTELLRNADVAMYRAKAAREGGHAVFDPTMHADLVERLDLEAELRQALRDEALAVHYQPVVALSTGEVVAVEALVRWHHPTRGPVPPAVFIPIAEETGLIHELGRLVLREACSQVQAWRTQSPGRPLSVTVNVSGRQLTRDDVVEEIQQVLRETGLPPGGLVLEMTESVLLEHTQGVLERLQRIRALGVRLAVDDFGTGYSSLSYLHRFPVDVLKIDRSFVARLGGARSDDALVPTIISLAAAMGLTAVAEGVENARQVLALTRLGCELGQGYHFAPPVPAHRLAEIVADLPNRRLDVA